MSHIKGLIAGVIGFLIGFGIASIFGLATNALISIGYIFGLTGWLLGVGVWDHWARGWFGLENKPLPTLASHGVKRYFAFSGDHKVIGVQYLVTFVTLFLLAGLFAMMIRLDLMRPGLQFLTPPTYNIVMSWHCIVMITVAVSALIGGLGN